MDVLVGSDLLLHNLRDQVEYLDVAIHGVRKIADIGGDHRDMGSTTTVARAALLQVLSSGWRCGCGQPVCRKQCGTQTERALQERTAIRHGVELRG
jgi:hypothetical protein